MPKQTATAEPVTVAPDVSAKSAGLHYVDDRRPGITRKRAGKGWRYVGPDGKTIRDPEVVRRINSLAIPPAYTDVWICPDPRGHIQATGRDAKGRKQYRYHPRWREVRDETKYGRMIAFAQALPAIRKRAERDLSLPGLPREKVLAAVIRLLETTLIRVGNEEYAKNNQSFGLTTMRDRHVDVEGSQVKFHFVGKSGKQHQITLSDARLAKLVRRCRDLPGYDLFQYLDDDGNRVDVKSDDVNAYLREISGEEYTAKDFRTWAGTVLACMALQEFEVVDADAQKKKNIVSAIERVSERLGNTPAVCRKSYVHPAVLDSYLDGTLLDTLQQRVKQEWASAVRELKPAEAAVFGLLMRRLAHEGDRVREAGA
jgi:DNA topoisomerase-1